MLLYAVVFMNFATTVTDFIVFNMLPNGYSDIFESKCVETVRLHERERDAERAMNMALAAVQFNLLDPNCTGSLDGNDLMQARAPA